jgi:hypothetical protein
MHPVPAHPLVRHMAIELPSTEVGFAVTHIPKSYLAPHQCLKPLQYYIRAGSDFVPTPHAVLSGLFGRSPQPFVFHMWSFSPAKVVAKSSAQMAVEFAIGFMLGSHGPGVARDLYVNLRISSPEGPSTRDIVLLELCGTSYQETSSSWPLRLWFNRSFSISALRHLSKASSGIKSLSVITVHR